VIAIGQGLDAAAIWLFEILVDDVLSEVSREMVSPIGRLSRNAGSDCNYSIAAADLTHPCGEILVGEGASRVPP